MSELCSSHIFMFAFRFDSKKKSMKLDKDEWKENFFNPIDNNEDYNQLSYFNSYARDILWSKKNDISQSFERVLSKKEFYLKIKNIEKPYVLELKNVKLNIFFTGIGILSIEIENHEYPDFDDILKINDFGRRIYPQFLGNEGVQDTKSAFLADEIKINGVSEDFEDLPKGEITVGKHIMGLMGKQFSQIKKSKNSVYIEPLLDDRMFVLCWYGNDTFSKKIAENEKYISNDDWYKYIFIDTNSPTVQNEIMKQTLLKQATYERWQKYETFYGVSKYSFVSLTDCSGFGREIITKHIRTLYHSLVLISLATKASIIKFSDDIVTEATIKDNSFEDLYQEYLMFYSKLNLQEVTHQEQGIELYDKLREQMKIDFLTEKLDNKFTKFFEFAQLKTRQREEELEKQRNESMNQLTLMGAIFLPPSLLVALFSMGIFDYTKSAESLDKGLIFVFLSALLGFIGIFLLNIKKKKYKWFNKIIKIGLVSIFSYLIYYSLQKIGEENKPQDVNITSSIPIKILKGDANATKR